MPRLRAQARRLCHDAVLADDIVQSACLKAWEAKASLRQDTPIGPWVGRILRNEYLQHCRRAWRHVAVDSEMLNETLVAPASQETESDMHRLAMAMFSLPNGQRDGAILVLVLGLTYDEAGEVLGCAAGTVKSRVNRARAWLQAGLERGTSGLSAGDHKGSGLERLLRYAQGLVNAA